MGKDHKNSLKKLKKKLKKLEEQLKDHSPSTSARRSFSPTSSDSPAAARRRTKSRSRSRSRSRSLLRPQDTTEATPPESRDTEEKGNIEEIDLTEENPVTNEDVDEEILTLLGDYPEEKTYGSELLPSIAIRWEAILKNGLDKEERTNLIKKYPAPINCKMVIPPKLNPEARAAAGEAVLKRDKAIEIKQNSIACAISALGLTLNNLCKQKDIGKENIALISDAARILCDYQHTESQTRKTFIRTGFERNTYEGVKDTNIDEWLFGADFADKLRACKAINRSAQDLKGHPFQNKNKANNLINSNLNSKGPTNNFFKTKNQKTHINQRSARQPLNKAKNTQANYTQQSSFRSRQQQQQNQYRRHR